MGVNNEINNTEIFGQELTDLLALITQSLSDEWRHLADTNIPLKMMSSARLTLCEQG